MGTSQQCGVCLVPAGTEPATHEEGKVLLGHCLSVTMGTAGGRTGVDVYAVGDFFLVPNPFPDISKGEGRKKCM